MAQTPRLIVELEGGPHAPDGIGRSKLAANVEKLLGVSATSRNWRTVRKLIEMAREFD
jgi:uncharacterized protein (DUF1697 family)